MREVASTKGSRRVCCKMAAGTKLNLGLEFETPVVKAVAEQRPIVLHILLIGFHHQKGSIVDYSFPPLSLPSEWKELPHMALPDGCHNYREGHVMFTLPSLINPNDLLFGVSCFRQIDSSELISDDCEITRSTVQKSITVICQWPVYDFLKSKLELTVHAYFNTKDFTDRQLIVQMYDNLNAALNKELALRVCCHSNQLTHKIDKYGYIILQLFKAILLEKRVVIYGPDPSNVSCLITSFLSLLPLYNQQLIDNFSTNEQGLPLSHFIHRSNIQPYLPLQEMRKLQEDKMKDGGALIGVTNPLYYKRARELSDVCLVSDTKQLEIYTSNLHEQLSLSTADLRFCKLLKDSVAATGKEEGSVVVSNWSGSTEWIQLQFKKYLVSLLVSCCHGDLLVHEDFNGDFVRAFTKTVSFRKWMTSTPPLDISPGHPCKGDLSLDDLRQHLLVEVNDLVGPQQVEQLVRKTG